MSASKIQGQASSAMARITAAADLLDEPDTGSAPHLERVASLSVGSRVRVIDEVDGWVLVEAMGLRGYVARDALEPL